MNSRFSSHAAGRRNAPRPLSLDTYDGSGQCVHPDALVLASPFAGFRYWLGVTPYPGGDDTLENPSIRVSEDGIRWHRLDGAADPIVPPPADSDYHNADPDLVLDGDTLRLFYLTRSRTKPHAMISVISSADGRHWSPPRIIVDQAWGVSPAVVRHEAGWALYYVHADLHAGPSHYELRRLIGASCLAFDEEVRCTIEVPGHHLWHIDVIVGASGFEALITAFPHGTDPSRSRLFHARSRDGIHFDVSTPAPLLKPSRAGWDNRMIYRSTFWKTSPNDYVVLYSAASWGLRCGIGMLTGSLDCLQPAVLAKRQPGRGYGLSREDAVGLMKYLMVRWVPRPILARLRPGVLGLAGRTE